MADTPDWYNRCNKTLRMRFWWWIYYASLRLRNIFGRLKWDPCVGWEWIWWATHGYTARLVMWATSRTTRILNEAYKKEQERIDADIRTS